MLLRVASQAHVSQNLRQVPESTASDSLVERGTLPQLIALRVQVPKYVDIRRQKPLHVRYWDYLDT